MLRPRRIQAALFAAALLTAASCTPAGKREYLSVAAMSPGTSWYVFGATLSKLLEERLPGGVTVEVIARGGRLGVCHYGVEALRCGVAGELIEAPHLPIAGVNLSRQVEDSLGVGMLEQEPLEVVLGSRDRLLPGDDRVGQPEQQVHPVPVGVGRPQPPVPLGCHCLGGSVDQGGGDRLNVEPIPFDREVTTSEQQVEAGGGVRNQ